jgi:hypothetical protein
MTDETRSLMLDLVEWIARQPRPYRDVMEAWRTSCPRLPIWEDAVDQGLVVRSHKGSDGPYVSVTKSGLALLQAEGRLPLARSAAAPADPSDHRKADRV